MFDNVLSELLLEDYFPVFFYPYLMGFGLVLLVGFIVWAVMYVFSLFETMTKA